MGIVAIFDLLQKSSLFCKSNHFQNLRLLLQSASANATGTHNTARKIFDIIRAMRTKTKNAVALSLAIAGAVALPMRSDAVSRKGSPPPPHSLMDAI